MTHVADEPPHPSSAAPLTTAPSCGPPAVRRCRTRPCGSSARRVARCPSTCACARASRCSTPAWTPRWSSRSPCSRCAATASTPPSSSPTSCCRSRPSASTSTSCPGVGPVVAEPVRTLDDVERIPDLTPEHVDVHHRGRARPGRRAGLDPAHRLRRSPLHRGLLPGRGRSLEGPRQDQGDDVQRPGRLGRADAQDRPDRLRPTWRCRSPPAPRPCSSSTPGPER